jgi:hypothetical protein
MSYADFLATKTAGVDEFGIGVGDDAVHPYLHPWQAEIVTWAANRGRAAIWADTGLGKTLMQIEWARLMTGPGESALIVAPLAVCAQTVREAEKVGVTATYVRSGDLVGPGLYVTNYEMVDHFDPHLFAAVVLDEASILKSHDGKTRTKLIQHFAPVPYRLACTATPAPNDPEELTNQAEFLGVMSRVNMLAAYFIHDSDGWRLKGHARSPMFQWMASWAVAIRRPSDMGYPDDGYILPGLNIESHLVSVEIEQDGQLFATDLGGVGGRAAVRRSTMRARCERAAAIVDQSHGLSDPTEMIQTWHGSPSTPLIEGANTGPIQPNVSDDWANPDREIPTANTCGSTTEQTLRSGSSRMKSASDAMQLDAIDTRMTPSTGQSASDYQSCATKSRSGTTDSVRSTESPRRNTTTLRNPKGGAARSAESRQPTTLDADLQLTTATTRDSSEGCSAPPATWPSDCSAMTQSDSPTQSRTSLEPWIVWCGLNDEQDYLARHFGDRCFSIEGRMTPEEKVDLLYRWMDGERPVLLTKPAIHGMGINAQHCARMAFVGLSDSYEAYYQSIRRCFRYGQERVVDVHIVLSQLEAQIADNVRRKEQDAAMVAQQMVRAMQEGRNA